MILKNTVCFQMLVILYNLDLIVGLGVEFDLKRFFRFRGLLPLYLYQIAILYIRFPNVGHIF